MHTDLFVISLETIHNLEVESYVLLGENFRTSSPGDSSSSDPERTVLRRQGGGGQEEAYTLQQNVGSLNVKNVL